jgi:DNA polymerase V
MSRRVMEALRAFTPDVEIYSIDEAFLNLAMLPDLSPVTQVQADLFDTRDRSGEVWLMRALDSLNTEYGVRSVRVGNVGGKHPAWAMRQAFRSPCYTTNWRELPIVR